MMGPDRSRLGDRPRWCEWCKADVPADAGPCPYSFACPTCYAEPGQKCRRPSEYECPMHVARLDLEHAESASSPALAPLPAQLDMDGGLHEIAPQTRQERLFAPAPEQLAGQTHLDTTNEETSA